MYDWLRDALDDDSCLVTANRRLARELQAAWSESQLEGGASAWRTPDVLSWQRWISSIVEETDSQADLPTRINAQHSQVLWERCLRKELGDDAVGVPALVRLARDSWQRLADARVSIREVARTAQSEDQRLFAAAAGRYQSVLEHRNWVDDAGLAELALSLLKAGRSVPRARRYVFVGFDRVRPAAAALHDALRAAGADCRVQEPVNRGAVPKVFEFENRDAELRAAGAWSREFLGNNPQARIAIVSQGLEQTATRDARLVREGFVPGWQYGSGVLRDAVNVSYGQRLTAYPAVTIALLALRWLVRDLRSTEVARLLQTPMLGNGEVGGRSRLELRLRALPDRAWSPSMLASALRGKSIEGDAEDWLGRMAALVKRRRDLPRLAAPAEWVILFDQALNALGWPGPGSRDSDSFQLLNRWRELLNDFARLDLVSTTMTAASAVTQLEIMAGEIVFQPESRYTALQLIGPLEATGAEFDAVWIAGMTATDWPPAGHPSALISRHLQVEHDMPDATPENTREWATAAFQRISGGASTVVCSYPILVDDVEQAPSDLLDELVADDAPVDPGWHAVELAGNASTEKRPDVVPAITNERVFGGAGTIQQQLTEPFAAFVQGRLGARWLDRQATGIPALLRGNVVHDTMFRLYQDISDAAALRAIPDDELGARIEAAADAAMQRHMRNSDAVLRSLLALERDRLVELVKTFVALDGDRGEFEVAALEGELTFTYADLKLRLRFDRIDRFADGGIAIIDYKTGRARQLVSRDGSVRQAQLFVYAMAADAPVVMLALGNIDSREAGFSGAGRGFTDEADWPGFLAAVEDEIRIACDRLLAGDVSLLAAQGAGSARQLNLLSRYTELRHEP
ncbi:MAG: PD-(D/E)XK nuclease family protein [Woeseiaceae bacterium]|nr:PD-(D/E)XK nuclease family protein [Woeseiaceae bacterium]